MSSRRTHALTFEIYNDFDKDCSLDNTPRLRHPHSSCSWSRIVYWRTHPLFLTSYFSIEPYCLGGGGAPHSLPLWALLFFCTSKVENLSVSFNFLALQLNCGPGTFISTPMNKRAKFRSRKMVRQGPGWSYASGPRSRGVNCSHSLPTVHYPVRILIGVTLFYRFILLLFSSI